MPLVGHSCRWRHHSVTWRDALRKWRPQSLQQPINPRLGAVRCALLPGSATGDIHLAPIGALVGKLDFWCNCWSLPPVENLVLSVSLVFVVWQIDLCGVLRLALRDVFTGSASVSNVSWVSGGRTCLLFPTLLGITRPAGFAFAGFSGNKLARSLRFLRFSG